MSPSRSELLSRVALVSAFLFSAASSCAAAEANAVTLGFSIDGTSVEFDESGLPSRMSGVLSFADGPMKGRFAGYYEEQLVPVIDPEYGFVGTLGTATFRMVIGEDGRRQWPLGTLRTKNHSLITGFDPLTGAILVESTGTITEGSGLFADVSGGLVASSRVILGDEFFDLDTRLELSISDWESLGKHRSVRRRWLHHQRRLSKRISKRKGKRRKVKR